MSKNGVPSPQSAAETWKRLFEIALMEHDNEMLPRRLQDAKDAVMDRIEDSFDTVLPSERRLLLAALNTISELQRLAELDPVARPHAMAQVGHAA